MKFYGREKQRKQIHKMMASDDQMAALIYGRRRIGKSDLIKQCLRESEVRSIYYECKQTNIEEDFETRHVPRVFEDICRQYLIRMNLAGKTEVFFEKIGKSSRSGRADLPVTVTGLFQGAVFCVRSARN